MATIDRPWARVRTPVPIPIPVAAAQLAELDQVQLAELIRSNLMPREGGRAAWDQLWAALREGQLIDRTFDVLEDFLDATEQAKHAGDLDDTETKRITRFHSQCDDAWSRLERVEDAAPLAWAGTAGDFQPSARKVIAVLISAIARHRSAVRRSGATPSASDQALWGAMRGVNLDPLDHQHRER